MLRSIRSPLYLSAAAAWSLSAFSALGQTISPTQSSARPFGLEIAAPVMKSASDTASASFQTQTLGSISEMLKTNLAEQLSLADATALAVDPSRLQLATAATARMYFVGEGAGYHNSLGFNALPAGTAAPAGGLADSASLIFPDASSSVSTYDPASAAMRTAYNPLLPGDYVDLGRFAAGTTLDFFLVANGAHGGSNVFTQDASRNPDRISHVVSFAVKDSPYLVLAFEDLLGGGDRDYNDVIVALDIGYENVQRLLSAPEPGTWLLLSSFLGLVRWRRHAKAPGSLPGTAITVS